MLRLWLQAWRTARAQERQSADAKRLVSDALNYPLLQELANRVSAQAVVIKVGPLKSGEYIVIETQEQYRQRQTLRDRLSAASVDDLISAYEARPINGAD